MEAKPRILLIEDEADIADAIADGLRARGYRTEIAPDGVRALRALDLEWDLVILDRMLPDRSGEDLLRYARQRPDYPAILVLSALSRTSEKIEMFREGCDDYLTKPFAFEELLVRVEALLRRPPRVRIASGADKDFEVDYSSYRARGEGSEVVLTPKEAALLRLLLQSPGRIVSRKEILLALWGIRDEPPADYVGILLYNLRRKLGALGRSDWVRTLRGTGYAWQEPGKHSVG